MEEYMPISQLQRSAAFLVLLLLSQFVGVQLALAQKIDGEIYLEESDVPPPTQRGMSGNFPPFGLERTFQFENPNKGVKNAIYERQIARWKDPLTLPHSRSECAKWATGHIPFDGDYKICVGWKIQWQWMYVSAFLRVTTANPQDIGSAIDECFKTAAVAAAIAAIVTGGSAAIGTFESVMKACLVAKLPDVVSVTAYTTSAWGPWE
jgi:hypothetical protein